MIFVFLTIFFSLQYENKKQLFSLFDAQNNFILTCFFCFF